MEASPLTTTTTTTVSSNFLKKNAQEGTTAHNSPSIAASSNTSSPGNSDNNNIVSGRLVNRGKPVGPPYTESMVQYLSALNHAFHPIWVYDPHVRRQAYANRAALNIWNCKTLEDFQNRDFRDNSDATERFLFGLMDKFLQTIKILPPTTKNAVSSNYSHLEEEVPTLDPASFQPEKTLWTIYPSGNPVVMVLSYSPHLFPLSSYVKHNIHPLNTPASGIETWSSGTTNIIDMNGSKYRMVFMIEASPQDPVIAETLRSLEMLRHVTSMVTLYDLKGRIVLQNVAAKAELQFDNPTYATADDLKPGQVSAQSASIELPWATWLPYVTAREHVQHIISCLQNDQDVRVQAEVKLKGSIRYHLIHALKIMDPVTGARLILVHEDDITSTVRQQKENIETLLANKIKDEFLANTSHELKTPLHGIIGLAESQLQEELQLHQQLSSLQHDLVSLLAEEQFLESEQQQQAELIWKHQSDGLVNTEANGKEEEQENAETPSSPTSPNASSRFSAETECNCSPNSSRKRFKTKHTSNDNNADVSNTEQNKKSHGGASDPVHAKQNRLASLLTSHPNLDNLLDTIAKSNSQKSENLSLIIQCARRLGGLVDDLLDLSKFSHTFRLQKREVDTRKVVEEVLRLSQPLLVQLRKSDVKLINHLSPDLPQVLVDEDRLKQIFHNLVANAIKFTHHGSIEITSERKGDFVSFSVKDTGIGIESESIQAIFKPFIQKNNQKDYGGSGLGLAVVQKLVNLHGGEIHCQSVLGRGSVFTFSLPIALPSTPNRNANGNGNGQPKNLSPHLSQLEHGDTLAGAKKESTTTTLSDHNNNHTTTVTTTPILSPPSTTSTPTTNTTLSRSPSPSPSTPVATQTLPNLTQQPDTPIKATLKRARQLDSSIDNHDHPIVENYPQPKPTNHNPPQTILSVDDDPINQIIIKNILAKEGYAITQAMSGIEALQVLNSSATLPDLILLDVMMPGLSGIEVCKEIRASSKLQKIPVIMISATTQKQNVEEGLNAGANDYIGKPFRKPELLGKIETHIKE